MKKDFYDKPIYKISNYIFGFLQSSFYFLICNIPMILFIMLTFRSPKDFNLLLLFICLIPLGPSLGALYCTVNKVMLDRDIYFSSCFWSSYKNNFKSYIKLWLIELTAIIIFFIDFQYFYLKMPEKTIYMIFITFIILTILIGFYTFAINSRFEFKFKELLVLSIYYLIKKFPITVMKVISIILTYYLCNYVSIIFLIFAPSILCLLFSYYDKFIFAEIESKFHAI